MLVFFAKKKQELWTAISSPLFGVRRQTGYLDARTYRDLFKSEVFEPTRRFLGTPKLTYRPLGDIEMRKSLSGNLGFAPLESQLAVHLDNDNCHWEVSYTFYVSIVFMCLSRNSWCYHESLCFHEHLLVTPQHLSGSRLMYIADIRLISALQSSRGGNELAL